MRGLAIVLAAVIFFMSVIMTMRERTNKSNISKELIDMSKNRKEIEKIERTEQFAEKEIKELTRSEHNVKETALTIKDGNKAFVDVTIGYHGKMVTVPLLIDTGATSITISPAIARRLGIKEEDAKAGESIVADGRKVAHYNINAAFVAVGPKTKKPIQVHIMPNVNDEESGLLGMSFLADFPHMIDMKSHVIRWM